MTRLWLLVATVAATLLMSLPAVAVTAPYFEDFETEPTCAGTCQSACVLSTTGWINATVGDTTDWTVDVGGTSSLDTGPSVDHNPGTSAGKYLYIESSVPCENTQAHLISPVLDLAGTSNPVVEFWYHLFGATQGSLHVDILDASQNVLQLDAIPAVSGDHGDVWLKSATVNLIPYIPMGQVRIRIRGLVGTSFTSDMAVDDFGFFEILPDDVGVSEILAPNVGGCAGGQTVTVELTNYGTNPQSNFPVQYDIDGGIPVVETFTGTLAPLSTATFSFATPASFPAGPHTINATTALATDQVPANDSAGGSFAAAPLVNSYPSLEDFEGLMTWTDSGQGSTWELGTPAGTIIIGAASGLNAWTTGLTTTYVNGESSAVTTVCGYDMSNLVSPAVRLKVWWASEFSWDGAALQSSIDGGQSWQTVGAFGDPNNWYTDNTIAGNPGGQQHGWTGTGAASSGGWVTAFHELTSLAGQPNVMLRIAWGTDTAVVSGDGFAFDDVEIIDNVDNVGIASIDSPSSGCSLGSETVTVTLENIGGNPVGNFPVEYVFDNGTPVVETFTGTIAPFSTAQFTFSAPVNASALGPHSLTVSTDYAADLDPVNDTMSTTVHNAERITAFPSLEDFEGLGSWEAGGTGSTWAFGTPAKTVIQGTTSGSNAWVTGGLGTGLYAASEQSWVRSICGYDFSNLVNPAIRFSAWWQTSSGDGAALQYSTDGQIWTTVGMGSDPFNWYTSTSLTGNPGGQPHGWTGSSGGYVSALHDLTGAAGQPQVFLRVVFGATSSTESDGFAFDDIEVFDNTPRLDVWDAGPIASTDPVAPGTTDLLVHALDLQAFGNVGHFVTSVTMQQVGTLTDADFDGVHIWLDDGDGSFDSGLDTLIDSQSWTNGTLTFDTTTPPLVVPLLSQRRVFVSVDLSATATPAGTFATTIAMESDLTSNTPAPITFVDPPILGPTFAVAGTVDALPFADDMNGAAGNRTVAAAAGATYPTATMAGSNVSTSAATANDAEVVIANGVSASDGMGGVIPIAPVSDPGLLAIAFPNGAATGAVDYAFDLDSYSAASDKVWLVYAWNNANEEDHDEDNVFLSVDGGSTWIVSLERFDFSSPVAPGWSDSVIDVSAALQAAGADFTNSMVIRLQAAGDSALGDDGLLFDDLWLGLAPTLSVERPELTVLASGASDALGTVASGPQSLTYTLRNIGDLPLGFEPQSFASSAENNVSNVTVGAPVSANLDPGATTTFEVSFEAGAPGSFSFDIAFDATDPALSMGTYRLTIAGTVEDGGVGGGGTGGSGPGTGGSDATPPAPVAEGDGCGCDLPGSSDRGTPAPWIALALAGMALRRRRGARRKTSDPRRTLT